MDTRGKATEDEDARGLIIRRTVLRRYMCAIAAASMTMVNEVGLHTLNAGKNAKRHGDLMNYQRPGGRNERHT